MKTNDKPRLLAIAWEWAPDTTPTGIRSVALLKRLASHWSIDVITRHDTQSVPGMRVHHAEVDESTPESDRWKRWNREAERIADSVYGDHPPDVILVFIMPYASAEVGHRLKQNFDRPLVFLLGDSPTCPDMHPVFPSRRHYEEAVKLEDDLIASSSATLYVSQMTLDRVKERLPSRLKDRLKLLRSGTEVDVNTETTASSGMLRLVYIGGMAGWTEYRRRGLRAVKHALRRGVQAAKRLRQYHQSHVDLLGSSPYYIGKALQRVAARHPEVEIRLDIYGERRPRHMIDRAMNAWGVGDVVHVGPVLPHQEALQKAAEADVLFMCLPGRKDDTGGGRISAKTYEYLSIDRPILAAIPEGENRDFLAGRPGVDIVDPDDIDSMTAAIERLIDKKQQQGHLNMDRSASRTEMSYTSRASELNQVLQTLT